MRLKIFGIPKLGLAFYGLLPSLTWLLFYRKMEWPLGVMIGFAVVFPFLFCRGFFRIRFAAWMMLLVELLVEMLSGAQERDFLRILRACLVFLVAVGLSQWVERKVFSAGINPQVKWYEGLPLTLASGRVSLNFKEDRFEGRIRRVDEQGFFVLLDSKPLFKAGQTVPFELTFKGATVAGEAILTSCFLGEKVGLGLQFLPKNLYHFNEYTGLVSRMRGEGL